MPDELAPMPDMARSRGPAHQPVTGKPVLWDRNAVPIVGEPLPAALSMRCANTYVVPTDDGSFKYELHLPPCTQYPEEYTGMAQFNTINPYDIVAFVQPDKFSGPEVESMNADAILRIANALIDEQFDLTCSCCEDVRDQLRGDT